MGVYTMMSKLFGLFVTMDFQFALNVIGWKTYMTNASFDILMAVFVTWYWVEMQGMTGEEVDVKFDGIKHSNVPDLNALTQGNADLSLIKEFPGQVRLGIDDRDSCLKVKLCHLLGGY